jgi:hypothetical protein
MQLNVVVFRHAHRLENGKIITHAHPYCPSEDNPLQPNSHTANELYLLDALTNATFTVDSIEPFVLELAIHFRFLQKAIYLLASFATPQIVHFLRGPPVFC